MGDDSLWSMFLEEVEVQSQILYEQLLLLEQAAQPETVLEALMRAAHSLKGAARIVEATKVTELAHVAEDVFVAAQQSRVNLHGDAIDALITATDAMVALAAEGAATQRDISHELAALRAILDPSLAPPSALSSPATSSQRCLRHRRQRIPWPISASTSCFCRKPRVSYWRCPRVCLP